MDGINKILKHKIKFYEENCCDKEAVEKIFSIEKFDGIIHFAALKSVNESVSQPIDYYQNNIVSLIVLLNAMKKFDVRNIVFSSSCTVYGQPDQLPVTEVSPFKEALTPYGRTKQICEYLLMDCAMANEPVKSTALRYFNPIGAHPSASIGELPIGFPNNLVPYLTQSVAGLREKLTVFGNDYNTPDGTCIRDYIHVVDLARAHVKALEFLNAREEKSFSETFNLGTGEGTSVLQLIKTFEMATGEKVSYKIGERRAGDAEKIYANVDKAKRILNWQTSLTLETALQDAWRWQQQLQKTNSN
jgi:UDP-glucose 4-epimerase